MRKYIYVVCVVFFVRTVFSQSSEYCSTPTNAVCKNLNLCPSLKALSDERKKNDSVINILRNSICGYEFKQYKVCCPLETPPKIENGPANIIMKNDKENKSDTECKTPDKLNGICITIQRCKTINYMFNKHKNNESIANFLNQSLCGYDGRYPKVCCSLNSNYETVPRSSQIPSQLTCGKSSLTDTDKIVGGKYAKLGAWPWIAAIGYKNIYDSSNSHEWLCAGTLISNIYVLTAAHCTTGYDLRNKILEIVRLGDLDLDPNVNDSATPIDYAVLRIIIHEEYNPEKLTNDIALLKLNDSVTFTNLIQPICLPILSRIREMTFVGKAPFVAGWGSVEFRGPQSTALLQVQIPVRDNDACKQMYVNQKNVIDRRVLCAGDKGKDSCQGDSGGPLMWPSPAQYYLVGIVSFGRGCGEEKFPGVYTRVTTFIEWIANNMNNS